MLPINKKLALAGLVAVSAVFANIASALPISGTISIANLSSTASVDFNNNEVKFVNDAIDPFPGNAFVSTATGDYAPLAPSFSGLTLIQYADFTYSPLQVNNPIWKTFIPGLASFSLLSIDSVTETVGIGIVLRGYGTAKLNGYDETGGAWSFSTSASNGTSFAWSSTANVPDNGMTAILMGFSLISVGVAARALKKRVKA